VLHKIIHSRESKVLISLLRKLRKDAGLTQGELAEKLGVQRQIITSIERGERMFLLLDAREYLLPLRIGVVEFMGTLEKLLLENSL
jgi:transcriptional regulator with XRE-family HTH domain